MARRTTLSGLSDASFSLTFSSVCASTIFISYSANAMPRQRRTPPPNGIHSYVP